MMEKEDNQVSANTTPLTLTVYALSILLLLLTGAAGNILLQLFPHSQGLLTSVLCICVVVVAISLYKLFSLRWEFNKRMGYDDTHTNQSKVLECFYVLTAITLLATIVAWFSNLLTVFTADLANAKIVTVSLVAVCAILLIYTHSNKVLTATRKYQWSVFAVLSIGFVINSWFEINQMIYYLSIFGYFILMATLIAIITVVYSRRIIDLINRKSDDDARKVLVIPLSATDEDFPELTYNDFAHATKQLGKHKSVVALAAIQKNFPTLEHLVMLVSKTTTKDLNTTSGSVENYMKLAKFIEARQKELNIQFKLHVYCCETDTLVCCSEIEQGNSPTQGLDFSNVDIMKTAYKKLISLLQRQLGVKEYDIVIDVTAATKAVTVAGCLATLNTTVRNMYICTNKLAEFDGSAEKIDDIVYMYDFITNDVTKLT